MGLGMDFNHVPADVRWAIANWPDDAERGAVTRFCERHQISRAVFYKIRRQAGEVGPVGATEPGSRRPHHSPNRTDEPEDVNLVGSVDARVG